MILNKTSETMAEVELIFCKVQTFPSARKPNVMLCTWTQKTNYKEDKFNPDSFVKSKYSTNIALLIIDHINIQRLMTQQIWISDKHPDKHPNKHLTNLNSGKHEQSTKCTHTIKRCTVLEVSDA